jgi:hypothetical protein
MVATGVTWSDELRLLFRPEDGYRELTDRTAPSPRHGLRRPLVFLLTLASMISLLTAGRLTLPLLLEACVAWSFVPALHVAVAAGSARMLAGGRRRTAETIDLYFMGFGPWSLWMLALSGAALFVPTDQALWTITQFWLLGSAATAFVWSAWINLGFFRGVLGLTLPGAVLAVVCVRAWVWGFAVAYFHLSDQLLPRLPWVPGHG